MSLIGQQENFKFALILYHLIYFLTFISLLDFMNIFFFCIFLSSFFLKTFMFVINRGPTRSCSQIMSSLYPHVCSQIITLVSSTSV